MNSENYIKIPSILQFRSLSYEKLSPTASSEKEKKTSLYLYDDIESPNLGLDVESIIEEEDVGDEEEGKTLSPSPTSTLTLTSQSIPLLKRLSFGSSSDIGPIPLLVKKMLTKEEMQEEEKIATQKGLVELGEQIAMKKLKENEKMEKKIELYEMFEEYVMDEEELKNKEYDDWLSENSHLISNKKQEWIDNFVKLIFAYSYLKGDLEEKCKEIEDMNNTIEDNDEQMTNYIKEIEELEEKINRIELSKKTVENIVIRLNLQLNQTKKDKMIFMQSFGMLMFMLNLLFFSIQKYGLHWHYVVIKDVVEIFLFAVHGIMDIIFFGCLFLIDKVVNYQFCHGFILALALMQLFQIGKHFIYSYQNKKNIKKEKMI